MTGGVHSLHPTLLTVKKAAEMCGRSDSWVRKAMREQGLPFFKIGSRIRIDPFDLDRWMYERSHRVETPADRALKERREQGIPHRVSNEQIMNNVVTMLRSKGMSDPFEKLRTLTAAKRQASYEWHEELKALRAAGFSVRAIASAAAVSHDTVWKQTS